MPRRAGEKKEAGAPTPQIHIEHCTFTGSPTSDNAIVGLAKAAEANALAIRQIAESIQRLPQNYSALHIGNISSPPAPDEAV